jgi:hypothetical protein
MYQAFSTTLTAIALFIAMLVLIEVGGPYRRRLIVT